MGNSRTSRNVIEARACPQDLAGIQAIMEGASSVFVYTYTPLARRHADLGTCRFCRYLASLNRPSSLHGLDNVQDRFTRAFAARVHNMVRGRRSLNRVIISVATYKTDLGDVGTRSTPGCWPDLNSWWLMELRWKSRAGPGAFLDQSRRLHLIDVGSDTPASLLERSDNLILSRVPRIACAWLWGPQI